MFIPKNSKDVEGLRAFLNQQREQACSTAAIFVGPLKDAMNALVAKIDEWIAKLPTGEVPETWCLDNQIDNLFNLLTQATACSTLVGLELSKATNGEQMATAVTAEINRRVASGELFNRDGVALHIKTQIEAGELVGKDQLNQLCSQAKITGFGEGQAEVRNQIAAAEAETNTIKLRREELQAASIPLPDADIERIVLGGTPEQFAARKAEFLARQEELSKDGIQLAAETGLANLWLEAPLYRGFRKVLGGIPALKSQHNPLAGLPAPAPAAKAEAPVFVV